MAFNFPTSPTNGQLYVAPSGLTYRYNSLSGVWDSYNEATGYRGSLGFTGSFGGLGYQGSTGVLGFQGSNGFLGSVNIGFQGSTGFQSSVGFQGSVGDPGGAQGFTGSSGDLGLGLAYGFSSRMF